MWMWMWAGKEANIVQKRGLMFAKKKGGGQTQPTDHRQAQKEAESTNLVLDKGRGREEWEICVYFSCHGRRLTSSIRQNKPIVLLEGGWSTGLDLGGWALSLALSGDD